MTSVARTKPRSGSSFEWIAACALAILTIASFAAQAMALKPTTTRLETVLFGILQFLLTIGFAWFSTRAISRAEFERSLKRFATSAYRRVIDVEDMARRLHDRVEQMRASSSSGHSSDLALIDAVIEDTIQVVRSSIADWADVIGPEIAAVDQIERLKKQRRAIRIEPAVQQLLANTDERIRLIDKQISALRSQLPPALTVASEKDILDDYERRFQVDWLAERHDEQEGLILRAIAGGPYKATADASALTTGDQLLLTVTRDDLGVVIKDSKGELVGRALNCTPLDYEAFERLLIDCYGGAEIHARFRVHTGTAEYEGERYVYYNVQITDNPLQQDETPPTDQ